MKTILPYNKPLYCSYNYTGALHVCGQNDSQLDNWVLNHYILWKYVIREPSQQHMPRLIIQRASVYEDFPFMDHHKMWKKYIKGSYAPIIKAFLADGNYVYYTNVDDYYISAYSAYKNYHNPHDGIINGYDDIKKVYFVSSYDKTGQYNNFEVPMYEFSRAWYSKYNYKNVEGEGFIIGLKLNPNAGYEADNDLILTDLKRYLNSEKFIEEPEPMVFGVNAYSEIEKYITSAIKDGKICWDKRIFRIISEHKLSMAKRIEYLYKETLVPKNMVDEYKSIFELAENTRLLHLKHLITENSRLLSKIRDNIGLIAEKEVELLSRIK